MRAILIGLTLILLDFQISSELFIIDILPDFIGYIILTYGLVRMQDEFNDFSKIHMFTKAMATYTIFACYKWPSFWMNLVVAAISTAASLYVSYRIVNGIRKTGEKKYWDLPVDSLIKKWKLLLLSSIFVFAACKSRVFSIITLVIYTIIAFVFLMSFYETKRQYESLVKQVS